MKPFIYLILLVVFGLTGMSPVNDNQEEQLDNPLTIICSENVQAVTPLWDGWILYTSGCDDDGNFKYTLANTATGESFPWNHDWDPASGGWAGFAGHPVLSLKSSPNGQWIALMLGVTLPDDLVVEGYEGMSVCEVILLCQSDGSQARPVALSILVGGGPRFDFTSDGVWVVGSPFLQCIPDAQHFSEFIAHGASGNDAYRFNYYALATGERGLIEDVDTGDGYWKCPYSENFRIENNWYDEYRFSNFSSGGLLGEYSMPGENPGGRMHGWVLPDAVLVSSDQGCGLLYVDGSYIAAPEPGWEVYCWLPDGTYLFSNDDGETVKHGKVDWPTFNVDWWVDHPELADCRWGDFTALRDSSGVIRFDLNTGELAFLPLSRDQAKP